MSGGEIGVVGIAHSILGDLTVEEADRWLDAYVSALT
jgi:hypothetical protein